MERKLIFLDTDGTLVSALSSPTPAVAEAIRENVLFIITVVPFGKNQKMPAQNIQLRKKW